LLDSISQRVDGHSRFYKLSKRLLIKSTFKAPLKDSNGSLIFDSASKLELFADAIEQQFKAPISTQPFNGYIFQTHHHHNNHSCHQKSMYLPPGKVRNTIPGLFNKSTPGLDAIFNYALKYCRNQMILLICRIFNGCARLEYFSNPWKSALVVMPPKPGKDPKLRINHRPISLLKTLSKNIERLILVRLNILVPSKITHDQFSFRRHHSTTVQIGRFLDDISKNNKSFKTAAILLDI